ncbi:MAG: hypothetical protein ABSG31_11525 [Tepidisphaeraceae bacterium]
MTRAISILAIIVGLCCGTQLSLAARPVRHSALKSTSAHKRMSRGVLHVMVIGRDGHPVYDASVHIYWRSGGRGHHTTKRSGKHGNFTLKGTATIYVMQANWKHEHGSARGSIALGSPSSVTIRLHGGEFRPGQRGVIALGRIKHHTNGHPHSRRPASSSTPNPPAPKPSTPAPKDNVLPL